MYIPKINVISSPKKALKFMKRFNFATMITVLDDKPIATHLPFMINDSENTIFLNSHMAKANPQWKNLTDQNVLIIFSEPHAYISPKNYSHKQNVPTWNYISVHAYGKATLITQNKQKLLEMESMIQLLESSFMDQWKSLDEKYVNKLLNNVVAFSIKVHDLQAKEKLSQNKSTTEKNKIISTLEKSKLTTEQQIADYMKKNK